MKLDAESLKRTEKGYTDFLSRHAAEIHEVLKRRYGTEKPVYCSKVSGLVRAMYPNEQAVADFFDSCKDYRGAEFLTTTFFLANNRGILQPVKESPGYCSAKWYRVNDMLPERMISYILEVHCDTEQSLENMIRAIGIESASIDIRERTLRLFFSPGKEEAAWQTFDAARKVEGTISQLYPKA